MLKIYNGKTSGIIGKDDVKYSDVLSISEPIKMRPRLSGGIHASIHPSMLIFKTFKRSYPIRGVGEKNQTSVIEQLQNAGWTLRSGSHGSRMSLLLKLSF